MVDISDGIVISDEERAGLRKAMADLERATSDADRRLAAYQALSVLKRESPILLPVLGRIGLSVLQVVVDAALAAIAVTP